MKKPKFSDFIMVNDKNGNQKKYVSEDQVIILLEHELTKYKDAVEQIFGICIEAKEKTEIIFQPKV